MEQLVHLAQAQPVDGDLLLRQWRLLDSHALLPGPHPVDWQEESALCDPLLEVVRGPLHWLGLVRLSAAPDIRGDAGSGAGSGRLALGVSAAALPVNDGVLIICY